MSNFISILYTLTISQCSPFTVTQEKRLEANKTNSDVDLVVGDNEEEEGRKSIKGKIKMVRTALNRLGPGQLVPRAQLSALKNWTAGPRTTGPWGPSVRGQAVRGPICLESSGPLSSMEERRTEEALR